MFKDIRIQQRPSATRILPTTSGIASAIRGANVLRGGATPALPTARTPMGSRVVTARPSVVGNILSPSREMLPYLRGGEALAGSRVVTARPSIFSGAAGAPTDIPLATRVPAGMGGAARTLPTGRSVVSPVAGDKAGILPSSTLATQGAFGGESGGLGAAAAAAPTALGPASLSGVESSLGKIGTDVMNTVTSLVPLAIKVVLAIIVIKIVIWLMRGRR